MESAALTEQDGCDRVEGTRLASAIPVAHPIWLVQPRASSAAGSARYEGTNERQELCLANEVCTEL